MKLLAMSCLLLASCLTAAANRTASPGDAERTLRAALLTRTTSGGQKYGAGELDILFFGTTRYLIDGPSHASALAALDEFVKAGGGQRVQDPLRRALLQRDLWQLFDWARGEWTDTSHDADRRLALRQKIAAAMRGLRLTETQLAKLPDNMGDLDAMPQLAGIAQSLRSAQGDWVMLGTAGGETAAPIHTTEQKGRADFLVMLRLPGGRDATRAWLATLPSTYSADAAAELDRDAKVFPSGTTWALVRVMNVIDEQGRIRATHLVESVQFRRYTDDQPGENVTSFGTARDGFQSLGEARMNRLQPPRLRIIQEWDREFSHAMQIDWLEIPGDQGVVEGRQQPFRFCQQCHARMGIDSIRSLVGFSGRQTPAFLETRFEEETAKAAAFKQGRPDWQELSEFLGRQR